MDGAPKPTESKLHKTLTHTGSIIGIITGILAIVGFFGIQPHLGGSTPKPKAPENPPIVDTKTSPAENKRSDATPFLRKRGIGTIRFEGGFPLGEPMLAKQDLQPQGRTFVTVEVTKPANSRDESVPNALVLASVPAGQLAALWREGIRLFHGVKLSGDHIHVSGSGIDADVPIDADGRLKASVLWPAKQMFLEVTVPGPVIVGSVSLQNGLSFGDDHLGEPGNTLPAHFDIEVPKPGEVLSAFKGQIAYSGTWEGARRVTVQALSPSGDVSASWIAELKQAASTDIRTTRDGILNEGLSGIKVLYGTGGS